MFGRIGSWRLLIFLLNRFGINELHAARRVNSEDPAFRLLDGYIAFQRNSPKTSPEPSFE